MHFELERVGIFLKNFNRDKFIYKLLEFLTGKQERKPHKICHNQPKGLHINIKLEERKEKKPHE